MHAMMTICASNRIGSYTAKEWNQLLQTGHTSFNDNKSRGESQNVLCAEGADRTISHSYPQLVF